MLGDCTGCLSIFRPFFKVDPAKLRDKIVIQNISKTLAFISDLMSNLVSSTQEVKTQNVSNWILLLFYSCHEEVDIYVGLCIGSGLVVAPDTMIQRGAV